MNSPKVLISACLLGQKVRYDGKHQKCQHPFIDTLQQQDLLVPVCPEMLGGLGCPRPPAEMESGADSQAVLEGKARVINCHGDDVTAQYVEGAYQTWRIACEHKVVLAIMKEFSPSCGTHTVHNGQFDGQYVAGLGVTTALLKSKGIKVFSDEQLSEAQQYYQSMVGFIY